MHQTEVISINIRSENGNKHACVRVCVQVGVGISGREGRQAANSSDFSFAKFKFLRRLLLLHGRWNYRRLAKVILYSFYKNVMLSMTMFYYTFSNAYSGTSLYEDYVYALFNVTFCGLPVIAIGALDRDLTVETVEKNPLLYREGRLGNCVRVCMVGWLGGWLVGWVRGWLVGWAVGWVGERVVGWAVLFGYLAARMCGNLGVFVA